ncbi:PAAR domain-containing protein [Oscillatoria sp. CS-180]|uniref:PAAR domain-containing protein n=1 Tax=Oscillatoria sp. CS-180 TaxID=3021720 RepID=UPI00232C0280|nr:PAAR domain-containing protein [Oscillatoria sp. CS-180]MDB9526524.1 PAAR domain-containing protein [Oscillatoria sp. CS-180]
MPGPPAARIFDATAHGDPLKPGPCSSDVFIGGKKAWRALDPAAAQQLLSLAKKAAKSVTKAANAITEVDRTKHLDDLADTAEEMVKIMGSTDQHACTVVKLLIPDGNGVVIKGSSSVFINGLPACRIGDLIQEVTSVNSIVAGEPTVLIGG